MKSPDQVAEELFPITDGTTIQDYIQNAINLAKRQAFISNSVSTPTNR
jgi:hypothetical protein